MESRSERRVDRDPRHVATGLKSMLDALRRHAREGAEKVDDIQARALFETTAEVLAGLHKAYEHYERGQEAGWKRG